MTTPGAPAEQFPPVDECPDCQQRGRRDGRVLIGGRGIYRCPQGRMWQDADEQPSTKGTLLIGASDSPPRSVGLGLVPPGPNPTDNDEERDEEGFAAAERAESLARPERVFNTLPTAEQVERGKEAARKRARE